MPSRKIESQLEALALLRQLESPTPEALSLLEKCLLDPVGLVVAKAAAIVATMRLTSHVETLLGAYDRLFQQPLKRDPQCWGKVAIAQALCDLEYANAQPFLQGLAYQQWEPVWGATADTAASLRAVCVLGLVACIDLPLEDKLWSLARALTDAQAPVRTEAVRALEQMAGREAAFLLRLKARMGDREASITGQVLQSLLSIEGAGVLPFLGEFLTAKAEPELPEEVVEYAALALGSSRVPGAVDLLITSWSQKPDSAIAAAIFRALSISREERALSFLLNLVAEGRSSEAVLALEALSLQERSEPVRSVIWKVVEARDTPFLREVFARTFR